MTIFCIAAVCLFPVWAVLRCSMPTHRLILYLLWMLIMFHINYAAKAKAKPKKPIPKKYFLTACAMVKNELNVVLEWIEFHRMQGVEHFVFLDDESTDDIYLLPQLYESIGYPDMIEVIPQNYRRRQKPNNFTYLEYMDGQMQGLNHCNTRFKGVTEWLLFSDVDEFMFSPKYDTLVDYIRNEASNDISIIYAEALRFGSSGVIEENRARFTLDPYTKHVLVINDIFNGELLLTSRNRYRAPLKDVEDDWEEKFNATCLDLKYPDDCHHNNGKSIWRPHRCGLAGVHYCMEEYLVGDWLEPSVTELRLNHYAFRSKEHMGELGKIEMGKLKYFVFKQLDHKWFSTVEDNATEVFREALLERLEAFPTLTVLHPRQTGVSLSNWITFYLPSAAGTSLFYLVFSLYGLTALVLCVLLSAMVAKLLLNRRRKDHMKG